MNPAVMISGQPGGPRRDVAGKIHPGGAGLALRREEPILWPPGKFSSLPGFFGIMALSLTVFLRRVPLLPVSDPSSARP